MYTYTISIYKAIIHARYISYKYLPDIFAVQIVESVPWVDGLDVVDAVVHVQVVDPHCKNNIKETLIKPI